VNLRTIRSRDSADPWLYGFGKEHLFLHFNLSTTYLLTTSSTASLVSNDFDNNDSDDDDDDDDDNVKNSNVIHKDINY
jgi:hypothetical protein